MSNDEVNLLKDVVFFSSTFRDLKDSREKILLGFQNLDIRVEAMEHFDATSNPVKEECLKRLDDSQVYLLVVAEMYGSLDPDTGLSFTELEYNRAVELKEKKIIKDIWVFKPTNNYKPPPEHQDTTREKIKKLKKFREKVCTNHTPQHYDNLDDLRARIYGRCYNSLKTIATSLLDKSGVPVEGIRQGGVSDKKTKFKHELKTLTLSKEEKNNLELHIKEMNKLLQVIGEEKLSQEIIDVKSVTKLGNYFYHKNDFNKAVEMYDLVLKYFPDDTRALNNKGSSLRGLSRRGEAREFWEKASTLDPDYTDPKVNLGGVLSELGRPEEALKVLDEVYKVEKDDLDFVLLMNLGLAHSKLNHGKLAHEFYEKAEKLEPKESQILINRASLFQSEKKFHKAIEYCDKILSFAPKNPLALAIKGSCLLELKDLNGGIEYLNESLKIDSSEIVTLLNLALAYRRLHDFGGGKIWYADWVEMYSEKVLQIDENDSQALAHLGWVFNRCGRRLTAIDVFDKALKIEPNQASILLDKSEALLHLNRLEETLAIVNNVINLDKPNYDLEALRLKYNLLIRLGKKTEAIRFIEELKSILSPAEIEKVKVISQTFGRINN